MPPEVKDLFAKSGVTKQFNVFMFVLDAQGQLVHGFSAVRGGARGRGGAAGPQQEITIALDKLKLAGKPPPEVGERPVVVPDLPGLIHGAPAGVRLFIRPKDQAGSKRSVVELVPMQPEEWKILSFAENAKQIEPEALKNWLVQLYPPAIRTADQRKPFTKITGSLRWEAAGEDAQRRYALLCGEVHLAKGDENESAFEGTLQAVVTYGRNSAEVQSLRGVVQGDYLYRIRGTQPMPLIAAIESRPDP